MTSHSFGARVRQLRLSTGLSLDKMAVQVGISRASLSKIERGERTASLGVAVRIADVLGHPLPTLIEGAAAPGAEVLTDEAPRAYVDAETGVRRETLFEPATGVEVVRYVIPAGVTAGPFQPHAPGARELFVVVAGTLEIIAGTNNMTLTAGRVVSVPGDVAHSLHNPGSVVAEIVLTIIQAREQPGQSSVESPAQ